MATKRNRVQRGDGNAQGNNWLPFGITGAATNAHYAPPGTGASSANIREVTLPVACKLIGILVDNRVAPGGVVVDTYTAMKNTGLGAVATAALATVTGAAVAGAYSNASGVSYAAGDKASVQVTKGAGSVAQDIQILLVFQP